jgi:hypothetical protein
MRSTVIVNAFANVMRTLQAGPIRSALFYVVLMAPMFLRDLVSHLGTVTGITYSAIILITLWAPNPRATRIVAWTSSLLIVAGYALVPSAVPPAIALVTRLAGIGAIWMMTALVFNRNALAQDRDQAIHRVQLLEGLLPICAECRKIRTDEGSWTDIEVYVSAHSKAQFTHALCNSCIRKLYPENADAIIKDMAQYKA